MKANENLREYTLRRTATALTTLSSNLANHNTIAKNQNGRLINQIALNLFKFVHKTNPSLANSFCDT